MRTLARTPSINPQNQPLIMNLLLRLVVFCLAFSGSLHASAYENSPAVHNERVILGWVEFVSIKSEGIIAKAKLDTGAKTSSIHAEDIEYFKRDGKQWVRFRFEKKMRPAIHGMPAVPRQKKIVEAPVKRIVKIKQHTVDFVERAAIDLDMTIGDKTYRTEFTLTDRDAFIYPVLLGRRFLEAAVIVDPSRIHITGAPAKLLSTKTVNAKTVDAKSDKTKPSPSRSESTR